MQDPEGLAADTPCRARPASAVPAGPAALACGVAHESRRLREVAAVERRVGRLRFADDVTMGQARAAFGPLIDALRAP